MYDADPFVAKKSVADRQEKAAKKKEQAQQTANSPVPKTEWNIFDGSPEVKLSTELRVLVENAIKTVVVLSPFICVSVTHACARQSQTVQMMRPSRVLLQLSPKTVCPSSSNN
jgi:hypothetical protein